MSKHYVPDTGDILWLHVASSSKPALVLSPAVYNKKTGLMVCCAISSAPTGYPFEVLIGPDNQLAVLADQIKSQGWTKAKISPDGRISPAELAQVRAKLLTLISKS